MITLQKQLISQQVDIDKLFGENVEKNGIPFVKIDHKFIIGLKAIWREAGDFLSRQYTGTDSTIGSVSENMKEGFWGKVNHKIVSAKRIAKNTIKNNHN